MIRTSLTLLVLLLLVLFVGPLGLLASWLAGSVRPVYALAFPSVQLLLWVAGVRYQVQGAEGLDPEQTYLFVSNHLSNVDPPVLLLAIGRHLRVMAKASLFRIPVFGGLLRRASMVPVQRDDPERARRAVDLAAEGLRRGHDFLVFGEGTRSRDGSLLPLKKGPFVMAIKAQVPVVPVVIRGTRSIMPKGSARVRAGHAQVRFLPPVPTTGLHYEDRGWLRDRVQQAMSEALSEPGLH